MDHKPRVLGSALVLLILVSLLFGALMLLPVLAQGPEPGRAAPGDLAGPGAGAQALPSSTGYAIDDGSTGFTPPPPYPTGNWLAFGAGGWNGDCIYTPADDSGDVAEWRPDLEEGTYQVQVHYWANSTAGTQRNDALYTVYYDGGTATRRVNQQATADGTPAPGGADSGWYTLGRYRFLSGTSGYVTLSDNPTVWGTGVNVVADAARFLATHVYVDDDYTVAGTNDGHLWGVTAFDNIPDGLTAVADYGTVHVRGGEYYGEIAITKPISVYGASTATTFITVPNTADTAVQVLHSGVNISGFTIESYGADYGVRNYDVGAATWALGIDGYSITDNVITGFDHGIRMRRAAGTIDGNMIHDNQLTGIRIYDSLTAPGPTAITGNTLYANGSGGLNYDIWVEESYAGTLVSGNTVTGDLGVTEACIHVENDADGLTISGNNINGCTDGVLIFQDTLVVNQIVGLADNTITGGTAGVRVYRTAGGATQREITIGGSVADANNIYGNSSYELRLQGYSFPVTATYNYWDVCDYRGIEDEIQHDYDVPALGTVTYDPALCVPHTIDVVANPTTLPADGVSTATITATVRDVAGTRVDPGTMVGITTSLGTVPWDLAEAEDLTKVTRTGAWANPGGFARASGGHVLRASVAPRELEWTFNGPAVSLIYAKGVGGGIAEVLIDGGLVTTIDMSSSEWEYRVEDVIATGLGSGSHTITVRHDGGVGDIWIDAFRSGGTTTGGTGRVVTTLTAATVPGVAEVWATVYDGHIITSTSTILLPIKTDMVTVTFQAADLSISKIASPASINQGQEVTYTITYNNAGPAIATGVQVTDTLPVNFVYQRSSSSAGLAAPTTAAGNKYVWNVGSLMPGATGTITVVAQPSSAVSWCVPVVRSNVAEILAGVPDPIAGNNSSGPVPVQVVVPTTVDLTASPASVRVSNGTVTTTLTAEVRDSSGNLVGNVPVLFTTDWGKFVESGLASVTVSSVGGYARVGLATDTLVHTATVTALVAPACAGMPSDTLSVPFIPGLPAKVEAVAFPTTIKVCGDTAVVTATVYDAFNNLVEDGTEVQMVVVPGVRGYMDPEWTVTAGGVATATLYGGTYQFGDRFLTVRITARRESREAVKEIRVDLLPGLPRNIEVTASPSVLAVDGKVSSIRARVTDCAQNPVADGTVVTFTVDALGVISPTTTTTMGGLAFATYRSLCTIGTSMVTALSDSASGSVTLQLEAGPADHFGGLTVTPDNLVRNCGDTALVSAKVYDRCGNLVKDGTEVTFGIAFDTLIASPNPAFTRNGAVSTTVTALNKPLRAWPQSLEQVGMASGSALPSYVDLWLLPGLPQFIEVTTDVDSIPINGDVNGYNIIVEAEVTDCSGTWIADGTLVTLGTDLGLFRESGDWAVTRPSVNGRVTATLTSGQDAGLVTVTATADSISDTVEVQFLPDEPYYVDVWGDPFEIPADGTSTSQITAWVRDYYFNPVLAGITVTFVTEHGTFAESGDIFYTTTTHAGGYAFATLVASTDHIGTVNLYAITLNGRTGPGIVQFTVVPPIRHYYLPIIKWKTVW